jgi:hypothetical protein
MTEMEIREMTAADIDAAVRLYRSGGWDHEWPFLERILDNPACWPLVGVCDGTVAATGLAAINGPVGWGGSQGRRGRAAIPRAARVGPDL